MGINWDSGLIHWKDHVPRAGVRYALSHLHPFVRPIHLAASDYYAARDVQLHVSFGLHTFTRATTPFDRPKDVYRDNREARTFCTQRYEKSLQLPEIFRSIETRRCEFTRGRGSAVNYVVVEASNGDRYAAFFDVRRFRKVGDDSVHLMVQSAYVLDAHKPAPGDGRIHFRVLLEHTLRGRSPRRPRLNEATSRALKMRNPACGGVSSVRIRLPAHREQTSCEAGVHRAGFSARTKV
jgi:hypothetical protein